MGSKKRTHPEAYKLQKLRTTANKKRAWKKHMEKNPNDSHGKKILEKLLNEVK